MVIPPPYCLKVINELHAGHLGILQIKSLARSYVWWSGMDADYKSKVKNCHRC